MIVQEKTPKELEITTRRKILWTHNLSVNLSKKDINKVFQSKTQFEILLHLFQRKVKAKVFTKYYPMNTKSNKGSKLNKRNSDVIVKDQNA